MTLTIVSVGFSLAPVSPDAAGGSEQILSMLDRALVAAGHRSIVVAPEGSRAVGRLVSFAAETGILDDDAKRRAQAKTARALGRVLAHEKVDLVHLHGLDFAAYLPPPGVPVLATLHLPVSFYAPDVFRPTRPDTWLNCVSATQHETCPPSPVLLEPIANGVPVEALQARYPKRDYALFLGRICREKGVHMAIEAAKAADIALLIAGEVHGYEDHQRYFEREVRPQLDRRRRFLGPAGFTRKRRLLTAARCLLAPFEVEETSSLVTREAIACGTPVIAFPRGALREAIEEGRTGFLVDSVEDMIGAISRSADIDPAYCRAVAREHFSDTRMIGDYLRLYAKLAAGQGAALAYAGAA